MLAITGNVDKWIAASMEILGCTTLEISHAVALAAYSLPGDFHRDPADRILVATARMAHLTLLTADKRILKYPHVKRHNARL